MRYPKEVILKDRTEAIIRPLEKDDESMLIYFYKSIPEKDRWYLKYDVTNKAVIHKWIEDIDKGLVFSIVAAAKNRIIAHAGLLTHEFGCTKHVGRLRIMVDSKYQHKRLGTWMLLDLIQLGMDKGLDDIRADFVIGEEDPAIESAHKLDFFKVATLKDYVKSSRGTRYDLQIMVKRLHKTWGDF